MHLLKHSKSEKPKPIVPIISHWKVPGVRKMRGRRYNSRGEDIGPCGPPKPIPDVRERNNVLRARREAAKLPPPVETAGFDLRNYTPLTGRILCKRPPQITEVKGIKLRDDQAISEDWFYVVKVGPGVTVCQPGDRVVFGRKSKPKPVRIGQPFHLGRMTAVVALVEA